MQPDVSGVRNTRNENRGKRHDGHFVPFGSESVGTSESRTIVYGAFVDVRGHHQTAALLNTDRGYHIVG